MLKFKILQSDQEATKLESPKGVNNSLIVSAKPTKTLSNKLMRLNGKWIATDKNGNSFESTNFIRAYLFANDCGSEENAQFIYEERRKKDVI